MRPAARPPVLGALVVLLAGCAGSPPAAAPAGDRSPVAAASTAPSDGAADRTSPVPDPAGSTGPTGAQPPAGPPVPPEAPATGPLPSAGQTGSPGAAEPGGSDPGDEAPGPEDPLVPRPALESPAPLGAPTCRAQDLSVVDADAIVTPSSVRAVYVVRTTGADCQLAGFPEVELRGAGGAVLPVTVRRGGFGLPAEQPTPVSLSRSTSVSFQVATNRTGSCVQAASIGVRLPGSGGALSAATELRVCGGAVGLSPVERDAGDH